MKIKRILYVMVLLAVFQVYPKNVDAQDFERECYKYFHHQVDSFLKTNIGEEEYLKKRDSMQFWVNLAIDSFGLVLSSEIVKYKNIPIELIKPISTFLKNNNFKCYYILYSKTGSNIFYSNKTLWTITFHPRKFLYSPTSEDDGTK